MCLLLQIQSLERQLARNSTAASGALEEMRKMSSRQEEWQRKLSDIEASNAALNVSLHSFLYFYDWLMVMSRKKRKVSRIGVSVKGIHSYSCFKEVEARIIEYIKHN